MIKKGKNTPDIFNENDYKKCINLLDQELFKLAKLTVAYETAFESVSENDVKAFRSACGLKSRAVAKKRQLDIVCALIEYQKTLGIKFTAHFCSKIIKKYYDRNIQKALLYLFFSYKKQNDIIFDRNVELDELIDINVFKTIQEKTGLYNNVTVELIINKFSDQFPKLTYEQYIELKKSDKKIKLPSII